MSVLQSASLRSARSRWTLIWIFALLGTTTAYAQTLAQNALQQIVALTSEKEARTPAQQKIDSQLLYGRLITQGVGIAPGVDTLTVPSGALADGQGFVLVDVSATVSTAVLDAIRAQGGQIVNSFAPFNAVRARIPAANLEAVANLPAVSFIRPAEYPVLSSSPGQAAASPSRSQRMNAVRAQIERALPALAARRGLQARLGLGFALIDSTGDKAHKADVVRTFGFTGTGVKIGVLSDGVDPLATMQAAGDLPAVTVLAGQAGSGAEGTAMLQIVYDLAPGAQLFFATGGPSQAQFATNILNLRAAGCDIIVDDITFFAEGVFQDGTVAKAVNSVVADGALYFSAAGNEGRLDAGTSGTWEGDFVDSGTALGGGTTHNFGGGVTGNQITSDASAGTGFWLKWSDPLGGSGNDYDLYLLDSTMTTVIAASTNTQSGTQDPFEFVGCTASPTNCGRLNDRLVIVRKTGAATRALNLASWRARFAVATTGCTFGHNAGANTISMAAVNVGTAGGGAFTGGAANPVETYSCDGLRRIFYTPAGTPITPGNLLFSTNGGTLLQKPDLAAADCTPSNTPGFDNPFCGTSAAAPHAAAIAALVKSARPTLNASQIHTALECLRPRHHGSGDRSRLRLGNRDGSRRSSIADHAGDDQLDTCGTDVFHLWRRLPGGHIHDSHDFELESGYLVFRQFPLAADRREHALYLCSVDGRAHGRSAVHHDANVRGYLYRGVCRSARNHQIVRPRVDRPERNCYASVHADQSKHDDCIDRRGFHR